MGGFFLLLMSEGVSNQKNDKSSEQTERERVLCYLDGRIAFGLERSRRDSLG